MHKLVLKTFEGLFAHCASCKKLALVVPGPRFGRASLVVAFNAPNQEITTACAGCSATIRWSPSTARVQQLAGEMREDEAVAIAR